MPDATTYTCPDLTTFTGLDELGLEVTGQLLEPDRAVLACRVVEPDDWCRRCGCQGVPRDTVTRELAHEPFGWRPTTLLVTVRRYRCAECSRVWRQDTTAAAEPRAKISRAGLRWGLVGIVVQHLSMSRVAEGLGVAWNTANDAVLAEGQRRLIADPARLDGVKVVGVDEHVWRHTRRGDKYVTVIIDLTPVRDGTGPSRLLAVVEGRSKKAFKDWLADRDQAWRDGIEVVAMDGFAGFKTATTEELPDAVTVMDPFHVIRLAGDALDGCRRRVQQELHGHRGRKGDPLYSARRTLHTGADLLTEKQHDRLTRLFAGERHLQVEITWGIYQRMISAYRDPDRASGRTEMRSVDETHLKCPRNGPGASTKNARETGGQRWGAPWDMDGGLSMKSRAEVTTRYAKDYARAGKRDRGRILDQVVAVTGWSRDNARRRLVAAAKSPPGPGRQVALRPRKTRAPKFSYDATKVLQRVWAASGGQCGKYLAVSMRTQLDGLERHGELALDGTGQLDPHGRYSPGVRAELLAMSAATIDRYLAPAKATEALRGTSTTKPSPLLRSSIAIRKATDEVEAEPGFFEGDTVAHCGPTLKGEFARTLNLTCVFTGWVFTTTVRNNAHTHILAGLQAAEAAIPFTVTGLDFDNGTEFMNHAVVNWSADRNIYFTRSRPYKKNDQATIESKNNHLVRKYAFYYRYDTEQERRVLSRLWPLVNDRLNYLTPTKKPTGYGQDRNGRRTRLYDRPATPLERLLAAHVLSPRQEAELVAHRDALNPADLARRIADLQAILLVLAKDKTEQLYLASFPTALPDVRRGVRVPAS